MTEPVKDSDRDWWVDEEDWADEAYYNALSNYYNDQLQQLIDRYPQYFRECE